MIETPVELLYKNKMHLTKDHKRAESVWAKLEANQKKYGQPYCPCQAQHNDNTICPCKFMRERSACRCGLYVRDGVDDK